MHDTASRKSHNLKRRVEEGEKKGKKGSGLSHIHVWTKIPNERRPFETGTTVLHRAKQRVQSTRATIQSCPTLKRKEAREWKRGFYPSIQVSSISSLSSLSSPLSLSLPRSPPLCSIKPKKWVIDQASSRKWSRALRGPRRISGGGWPMWSSVGQGEDQTTCEWQYSRRKSCVVEKAWLGGL